MKKLGMMKTILMMGCALALLFAAVPQPVMAANSQMNLTVGTTNDAKAGDTVTVRLVGSNNPGLSTFAARLAYDDSDLEYVGTTWANTISSDSGNIELVSPVTENNQQALNLSAILNKTYSQNENIATEQGVYVMLHKPAGVVSSTQDPRERTVLDLLPQHLRRRALFPVGRLDKDTEGLLLLTNDGPLAHALLAPGRHVDKVYYVEVDGRLDQQDRRAFQAGVTLADGTVCQPADLTVLDPPSQGLVTLREGKYHQVKRMLAARGKPVTYLKRLSMGPLTLDPALPAGAWRPLTPEEKASLGR